jgi:hypothetical protein
MIKRLRIFLLLILIFNFSTYAFSAEKVTLSIPKLNLASGERIMGFTVFISQGLLFSLPNIPPAWDIHIENIGKPNVTAYAINGAAAFQDAKYFHDFLILEKSDSSLEPFDIEVKIDTTNDFENFKNITFQLKDISIKKLE